MKENNHFVYPSFYFAPVLNYLNTYADWAFYDTSNLTLNEFHYLTEQTTIEGAILVVMPGGKKDFNIDKYCDFDGLCAAPGDTLQRFSVAGVGSSDVGAAAFARSLADYYREPVGAIVAGYGVADLLEEALSGWFILGADNRDRAAPEDNTAIHLELRNAAPKGPGPETKTLTKLLMDDRRKITSIAGHSKGSLGIAYALHFLEEQGELESLERAKLIEIITAGAIAKFPEGFENLTQFLGSIDSFGKLNSRSNIDHTVVPNAWHHLNRTLPFHLDLAEALNHR